MPCIVNDAVRLPAVKLGGYESESDDSAQCAGYAIENMEVWHRIFTHQTERSPGTPFPDGPIVCKRIRAIITNQQQMELHHFPFDHQELSLELLSRWPRDQVNLVRNANSKYRSLIHKNYFSQKDECETACDMWIFYGNAALPIGICERRRHSQFTLLGMQMRWSMKSSLSRHSPTQRHRIRDFSIQC